MISNSSVAFEAQENEVNPPGAVPPGHLRKVMHSIRQFGTVSEVLRALGATFMVGAMSVFLMQGWHEGNDLDRYFLLLAQTLLLTAGGFGLSFFLKEYKGARLFFGLSLLSVTANFTILGALIYSVVQFDSLLGQYPGFATWTVNDPGNVFATIAAAVAILAPVALLAYTVMARRSARWLTATYLLANTCLLLPVRLSLWTSLLAVVCVLAALVMIKKRGADDETLATFEGRFSKLCLFAPPAILFVRSWYLYQIETLAIACLFAAGYLVVRHVALKFDAASRMRMALDVVSLPLMLATAGFAVADAQRFVADALIMPLFALLCALMIADLVQRSEGMPRAAVIGLLGAMLICTALCINELLFSGFGPAFVAFAGCLATMTWGYWMKNNWVVVTAAIAVACLAVENLVDFVHWFDFNNWVTLSVLGASAIVLASVLDRHGPSLKLRLDTVRHRRRGRRAQDAVTPS